MRRSVHRIVIPETSGSREGQKILIYGASGSIGTASVQLAEHFGAEVTAVCDNKDVEVVRSLGANNVVDYLQQEFTEDGDASPVHYDGADLTRGL